MESTRAEHLGDIKKEDVEVFKKWKKEKGAADRSVNNALKDIQAIYNHAIRLMVGALVLLIAFQSVITGVLMRVVEIWQTQHAVAHEATKLPET